MSENEKVLTEDDLKNRCPGGNRTQTKKGEHYEST